MLDKYDHIENARAVQLKGAKEVYAVFYRIYKNSPDKTKLQDMQALIHGLSEYVYGSSLLELLLVYEGGIAIGFDTLRYVAKFALTRVPSDLFRAGHMFEHCLKMYPKASWAKPYKVHPDWRK